MADVIVVTNVGMGIITNRIIGAGTEPKYIGWGTGTTAADAADTGLETAAAESRTSGTSTRQSTNASNDTYQVVGVITCASEGKTISEIALFDASTDGNCFLRGTFDGLPLNVDDSIQFTIKSIFDQA